MKISYNLLKQYIATDLTPPQIAELLTDGGLEVESIETFESVKGGLKNLVVGEVLTCEKHPDADKLKLTTVNVGNETPLNIVCGAPNVAKGQKVIIALIGAKLYPAQGEPFEIKKSKIRGAVSEGMICAEDEIGLGTSHEGIIILPEQTPIGMLAANYFNITNDFIFEIGLTPNRTDAISHIGVARDLSALLKQRLNIVAPIQKPAFSLSFNTSQPCPIDVTVQDVELCPRYSGIYLQDVQIAESPAWLKNTLASIGLRSINNVVDITNFVMHECGQPLHAFDADKIVGKKIIVSKANEGHKFTTLDSNEHTLKANYLMINNGSESMCIAGVFGGLHSGVTENTKSIFIESAYFNAGSVRKTARELQLKTDSSFRFERGTDPNITLWALQRAASLIIEITGAKAIGNLVDLYPTPIKNATLAVNPQRICNYIGKQISVETIENILTSLEINVVRKSDNELQLEIPTFKTDVTNEADIVEEVMRIYGFNNIEIPAKINASVNYIQRPQPDAVQNYISNRLSSLGFNEMMALSLTKDQLNQITKTYEEDKAIKLLNPISNEVNILRQHLLTGALQAVAYNINRKQKNLKFYEFGKVYFKNENSYKEEKHLSITISGQTSENNWQNLNKPSNFYFIKETFVSILNSLGINEEQIKLSDNKSEYAQYSFNVLLNNRVIGSIAKIDNSILKKLDIDQEVFYADLFFDELILLAKKSKPTYKEISKYPEVKRDLALLVDKAVLFEHLHEAAINADKKIIKQVSLFDIYEGDKLPEGKKSYALSFTLLDEQSTLTDKIIEKTMEKVVNNLQNKVGAALR